MMNYKNQNPILLGMMQSELEVYMYGLAQAIKLAKRVGNIQLANMLNDIKLDWQHKINLEIERGNWK